MYLCSMQLCLSIGNQILPLTVKQKIRARCFQLPMMKQRRETVKICQSIAIIYFCSDDNPPLLTALLSLLFQNLFCDHFFVMLHIHIVYILMVLLHGQASFLRHCCNNPPTITPLMPERRNKGCDFNALDARRSLWKVLRLERFPAGNFGHDIFFQEFAHNGQMCARPRLCIEKAAECAHHQQWRTQHLCVCTVLPRKIHSH